MKVGQNGTTETPGAKPKGKLEYFNATMGKLFSYVARYPDKSQPLHNLT
jgi:hypothetical protein